jgi:hypothetical protein
MQDLTRKQHFGVIHGRNFKDRGPQRAASNHGHEQVVIVFRGFVRVRRFEAVYRLV